MPSPPSSAVIILSDSDDDDDAAALLLIAADRFTSSLTTEAEVQALCEKHGVPGKLAALPAGDRRACSPPPARAVCVYAHALEAGVRFPLPAFFCQTLSHFDLAPGQLTPDGWRVLVGFLALCHDASVPPSVAVFRHFFSLRSRKGWYCFRCKEGAGALVTGLGSSESDGEWKRGFFFLTAPEEWPCPVRWGAPTAKVSAAGPELSSQDKKSVVDLVYKHGAAVDIRTYLREADIAAAFSSNLAGASPPPPPPSPRTTGDKGMNPPEEKAAETEKVNTEPDGDTPPLSGKKRKQGETAIVEDELCRSALTTPPPASPPGLSGGFFDPKPQHSPVPDAHDGDSADWKVSQKVLECIVTPSRDDKFAASKPSDVVASTYVAMLQVFFQPNRSPVGVFRPDPDDIVCVCRAAATVACAGRELRVLLLRLRAGPGREAGGAGARQGGPVGAAGQGEGGEAGHRGGAGEGEGRARGGEAGNSAERQGDGGAAVPGVRGVQAAARRARRGRVRERRGGDEGRRAPALPAPRRRQAGPAA
uniref:Transposase (putative) gypsy type domain-containing protein n=1 Tax=Triticum urartu TaxID=4572 RepID=A0A8R7QZI7_TRIUA